MSEQRIGRIFVIGSPRSGTTLLQCLLAAHSQIASLPETWFFYDLAPKRNKIARAFGLATPPQRGWYHKLLAMVETPPGIRLPRKPIFIRQYTNAFFRLLDAWTAEQHKRAWLEKTPRHVRHIAQIERYAPDAKFIHIVRSGPDNIASHYDVIQKYPHQWERYHRDLDYCIQHWIDDVSETLKHAHRPNHLAIGYKQLVEETQAVMTRACEFIGLPFEEAMLQNYSGVAERVTLNHENWKTGVTGTIASRDGMKFNKIFTEEQRQHILDRIAEVDLSPLRLS